MLQFYHLRHGAVLQGTSTRERFLQANGFAAAQAIMLTSGCAGPMKFGGTIVSDLRRR
jgi:hypothetical protein